MATVDLHTADTVRQALRRTIRTEHNGNQSAAARAWGIRRDTLNKILRGDIGVSHAMAQHAGFELVTGYVRTGGDT